MGKRIAAPSTAGFATTPVRLLLTDAPDDWRSLVEQIAELEDILLECGAIHDQDAIHGRTWLQNLLVDKRRQLRRIDVAI